MDLMKFQRIDLNVRRSQELVTFYLITTSKNFFSEIHISQGPMP